MEKITVFTPTFNRAYILKEAYISLLNQTCADFIWLIIDDGSTDETRLIVQDWMSANQISIVYKFKANGGMHTAHNLALSLIQTDLCFCLDSDDRLKHTAIEEILGFWASLADRDALAGIVMHENYRLSGKIIGSNFPIGVESAAFRDLYYKYRVKGDKLLIYRTDLLKANPYPVFENELFVALDYKYLLIDKPLAILNTSVYEKEYLEDGHSLNVIRAYARNPIGFMFYHELRLKLIGNWYVKFKSSIHLTACSLLSGQETAEKNFSQKIITLFTFPLALIWYWRLKKEKKALGLQHIA